MNMGLALAHTISILTYGVNGREAFEWNQLLATPRFAPHGHRWRRRYIYLDAAPFKGMRNSSTYFPNHNHATLMRWRPTNLAPMLCISRQDTKPARPT